MTEGVCLIYQSGAGAPSSSGAYGSVGSTYRQTDAASGAALWSKVSGAPNSPFAGWSKIPTPLAASATYDPPSLADGTQQTTTVTVTGAAVGDYVQVSFGRTLSRTRLWGEVTAADTVTVYHRNDTGSTVDLASSTLRVVVAKA
jgi:hypothetical protein